MIVALNNIADNKGARQVRKLIGRGIGSGKGKTSGKGGKGQTARSGVAINGFEGGQTPIYRRLPKRGFHNDRRIAYQVVNLDTLQKYSDAKKLTGDITPDALKAAGIIRSLSSPIKLLGKGALSAKLSLSLHAASASAKAAVEKAGGSLKLIAFEPFNLVVRKANAAEKPARTSAAKKSKE